MAKVSIITASFNYKHYIKETIESVINQTYSDWELLVVDDGSTDNSLDVINSYCQKDERIKLYQHEGGINKGLAETIKLGISKVNSDWIIFLESDDSITSNYIEEKLKIIEKYPNVNLILNDINMFGDEDVIEEYTSYFKKQKRIFHKYKFPVAMLKPFRSTHTNLIPTFSCVMVKKDVLDNIDFDSPIKKGLDYYLWLQVAKKGTFYYLDQKLTNWRMHKDSYVNADTINKKAKLKYALKRQKFLYGKFSFIGKILLYLKYLRSSIIRIHIKKNRKEIIFLGKLFRIQ